MGHSSDPRIYQYISTIGPPVTPEEVDTYDRLSQIQTRETSERGQQSLRQIYGMVLLGILSAQIIAVNIFIYLVGFGFIEVDRWVTTTYIGGTLGEVSGMTFLVIRYLFPIRQSRS